MTINLNNKELNEILNFIPSDKVVVVCPTYNRRYFFPSLIYQFAYQNYPSELLNMIIYDDSEISNKDLIEMLDDTLKNRIIYIHDTNKKPIGYKRNILNTMAKNIGAKYIVCFDDDDYYQPFRILYSVYFLKKNKYLIGGSSALPIYYQNIDNIYIIGPFYNKLYYGHALNGTFVYDVKYLDNHSYDNTSTKAEETKFLNGFRVRLLQIPYEYIMVCIAHISNTIPKDNLKNNNTLSQLKLEDFIKDKKLLDFFKKTTNQSYNIYENMIMFGLINNQSDNCIDI
jgi:hypothetical protein